MSVPNEQTSIANLGLLQSWTVTIPKKIVLQSVGFFYEKKFDLFYVN